MLNLKDVSSLDERDFILNDFCYDNCEVMSLMFEKEEITSRAALQISKWALRLFYLDEDTSLESDHRVFFYATDRSTGLEELWRRALPTKNYKKQ